MRTRRERSSTGVYHVMIRGINKQDVFLDEHDFRTMQDALWEIQVKRGLFEEVVEDGLCTIYAYCILHNHIHILIKEGSQSISPLMKRLQDIFAVKYNMKYERVGHVFHGPFNSTVVEDDEYFHQLLRYIHRNPVKAGQSKTPSSYKYSSWHEFFSPDSRANRNICNVQAVLQKYPLKELKEWINMDVDDDCMDIDKKKGRISDAEAMKVVVEISNCSDIHQFRCLHVKEQFIFLLKAMEKAPISKAQAARISSLSVHKIERMLSRRMHLKGLEALGDE